jgi:hypothetical protein
MHCCDATASSFVAKVQGRVFANFRAIKRHSYMTNWLFGLPGRILYEHSPWCQRKCWSCSWLFFFTFLFSVSLDFQCMANAFFPKRRVSVTPFIQDLHKIRCCSFVGSVVKSHRATYSDNFL